MTYSAVEQPPSGGDLICKLSLARTTFDGHWERLGPMFPVCNDIELSRVFTNVIRNRHLTGLRAAPSSSVYEPPLLSSDVRLLTRFSI
jgi:hypothetical protein